MADLHESHEEQVERTVSSPEAVTEYLNGYVRPYRNEISFAIRNGAYSLSGRYFLGLCDGGIRDAAVLFRASGSYQGSRPREMLLC